MQRQLPRMNGSVLLWECNIQSLIIMMPYLELAVEKLAKDFRLRAKNEFVHPECLATTVEGDIRECS